MKKIFILSVTLFLLGSYGWAADLDLIGVGAQAMGMGKNGLALFDDINTIFLNPAGLTAVDRIQFTSMYTRYLGEVNYVVAGVAVPLKIGTFGISLINAQVSDIPLTAALSDGSFDQNNIYFTNYGSHVFALSYALGVEPRYFKMYAGLRLKFYGESFTGGAANGYDLDLGLRAQPYPWLRLALMQENLLPSSFGASLNWNTGRSEPISSRTKAAVGLWHEEIKVGAEIGLEKYTLLNNYPLQFRLGAEWWPNPLLALRAGLDQELIPSEGGGPVGSAGNFTFGMGLRFSGFLFDYAYHPFSGYTGNTAHFFSISYIGRGDFVPPSIEYKFVSKEIYRNSDLKIGIKVSEKVRNLKAALPEGGEIKLDPNDKNLCLLEWKVPKDIDLGRKEITLFVEDEAGNKASKKIIFEVAPRSPHLEIIGLKDRETISDEFIDIKGKIFGENLILNDEVIVLDEAGRFNVNIRLKPGINKLTFKIQGEGGLEETREIMILRELKEGKKR